jgi:hypothetical protein
MKSVTGKNLERILLVGNEAVLLTNVSGAGATAGDIDTDSDEGRFYSICRITTY